MGELLSRAHLLELVWGGDQRRCVDAYGYSVSRLRRKLELDGRHVLRLRSVYQSGYRMEVCSISTVEQAAN
ncbi:helix-turn-helix domain-containing protein [uncultured Halomonas sp.]|uniref:winged helix-turn-helix domain-containing protein n=1 Tax=unclassified Halomonas TaxID=2609666 RepID=UPI00259A7FD2|nr:helix-turn-helix domain-containing protein [uncultured Halomonas sp.]